MPTERLSLANTRLSAHTAIQKRKSGEGTGTAAGEEQGMYETKGGEMGESQGAAAETVGGPCLRKTSRSL